LVRGRDIQLAELSIWKQSLTGGFQMLYALLILVVVVPYLPAIGVLKRAGYSGWL